MNAYVPLIITSTLFRPTAEDHSPTDNRINNTSSSELPVLPAAIVLLEILISAILTFPATNRLSLKMHAALPHTLLELPSSETGLMNN